VTLLIKPRRIIDGIEHARCVDCEAWKPLDAFYRARPCKDGTRTVLSYCKACMAARSAAAYKRHMLRQDPEHDAFVKCRVCRYPTAAATLHHGRCPQCRALMADGGMHPTDPEWCDQAKRRLDHEEIMVELERRAAAGEPLFPERRNT